MAPRYKGDPKHDQGTGLDEDYDDEPVTPLRKEHGTDGLGDGNELEGDTRLPLTKDSGTGSAEDY